jgi:hypothetical protein
LPPNHQALQVTDRYQHALRALQAQTVRAIATTWVHINPQDLQASYGAWADQAALTIIAAQRRAATLAAGYLAAYQRAAGQSAAPPAIDAASYAGVTQAGKHVRDMLDGTLYGALERIAENTDQPVAAATRAALAWALTRNTRMAADEATAAGRSALHDTLAERPDTYQGWRRVSGAGTCVRCLADTHGTVQSHDARLVAHFRCTCVPEPVLHGMPDRVHRPTGLERFRALTAEQQDKVAGPAAAKALRTGEIALSDLVATQPMAAQPDQLAQRPLKALVS